MHLDDLISQLVGFVISLLAFIFVLTGGLIFRKKQDVPDERSADAGGGSGPVPVRKRTKKAKITQERWLQEQQVKEQQVKEQQVKEQRLPEVHHITELHEPLQQAPTHQPSKAPATATRDVRKMVIGAEILKRPLSLRK